MRCKALNRDKQQCGRHAVSGREFCPMHGGKTLRGIAHPKFRHGRFSRSLPVRLVGRYEEAKADPELLELRNEIALIHARVCDLLTRVDSGEAGELWQVLHLERNRLLECRRKGDNAGMSACLNNLLKTIETGHQDFIAWSEISRLVELQRKLVETEHRRLVAMHQYMSYEEAMALAAGVMASVKGHVTDRTVLAAIARDFEALMSRER